MNDVQPASKSLRLRRLLGRPQTFLRKVGARIGVARKFSSLLPHAERIQKEIQSWSQKRDDAAFAGKKEEYLYAQGFCDGIEWVLKKLLSL